LQIYVEIVIQCPIDEIWRFTQTPELHERWDLRFSEIRYLQRPDPSLPQRFEYTTRIGFGMDIKGAGETTSVKEDRSGARTSALRFWSDDPKSLIKSGSGYWRYEPVGEGVRFITGYDYTTRFGVLGKAFDAVIFRPMLGWATAWSFDRLRLWLESGVEPAAACQRAVINLLARATIAFVFFYQGFIPKILYPDADERQMLLSAGVAVSMVPAAMRWFGISEIAFAGLSLFAWRARWPLVAAIILMIAATIAVAATARQFLVGVFNPVTLNVLVSALAGVGLIASRSIPTSRTCLRKPGANT
jgi:hypothetical protein